MCFPLDTVSSCTFPRMTYRGYFVFVVFVETTQNHTNVHVCQNFTRWYAAVETIRTISVNPIVG